MSGDEKDVENVELWLTEKTTILSFKNEQNLKSK